MQGAFSLSFPVFLFLSLRLFLALSASPNGLACRIPGPAGFSVQEGDHTISLPLSAGDRVPLQETARGLPGPSPEYPP